MIHHWLHVPVGKFHNYRYVPLHSELVELITEWQTGNVNRITATGRFLTDQVSAINRGVRLEAVAALLGHKNLEMTLVYARIADTPSPTNPTRPARP